MQKKLNKKMRLIGLLLNSKRAFVSEITLLGFMKGVLWLTRKMAIFSVPKEKDVISKRL